MVSKKTTINPTNFIYKCQRLDVFLLNHAKTTELIWKKFGMKVA